MKKILAFLIYFILFLSFTIYFFPKEAAYNYLEHKLEKEKIIISDESRKEKTFSFSIENGKIFYQGMNVSDVKKVEFSTFLFFTKINIYDVKLLGSISNLAPSPIETVNIKHSILNFDKIEIKANGTFGEINGAINIFTKILTLELKANKIMKNKYSSILREMKLKEGKYFYEYKFK